MTMQQGIEEPVAAFLSQPILVPLDGSDVADGIVPYISQIAKMGNAPLVLLTVVDVDALDYPSWVSTLPPTSGMEAGHIHKHRFEENARVHAYDKLKKMAADLENGDITAEVRATVGRPAEEILRVAEEEGCGLIAMSTHGRNAITRGILGSVTDKVLHASDAPVLTIAPERARKYQEDEASLETVIVPLDGSEFAERALPYAEKLASQLSLGILLARVVRFERPHYADSGVELPDLTEQLVDEAVVYLERVSQEVGSRGLKVETKVLRGAPAPVLLDLAHQTPQSFIAMTTHARSGLSRWMMGSVAEALVRGSGEMVLLVRTQPQ